MVHFTAVLGVERASARIDGSPEFESQSDAAIFSYMFSLLKKMHSCKIFSTVLIKGGHYTSPENASVH